MQENMKNEIYSQHCFPHNVDNTMVYFHLVNEPKEKREDGSFLAILLFEHSLTAQQSQW